MPIPRRAQDVALFLVIILVRSYAQTFTDIKPSPQQVDWQDLEMGAIIHFGPNTFLDREWGDGDPEQWMQALQSAGIKYVVFVAKHHDGFCLWPIAQTDYSVKSGPWENAHGEVVHRVEQAARKYGLKFGVYLSPRDRHEPSYSNSAEYDKYYSAELDELAQGYGVLVSAKRLAPCSARSEFCHSHHLRSCAAHGMADRRPAHPEICSRNKQNGKWIQVFKGNAIGQKRIDHFAPVTASRVRLNILSSSAQAHIREFQVFDSKDGSP